MGAKTNAVSIHMLCGALAGQIVQMCKALKANARAAENDELANVWEKYAGEFGRQAQTFNEIAQQIAETRKADGSSDAALPDSAVTELMDHPAVQQKFREMVSKGVADALGDKLVPSSVHGAIAYPGITAVPRFGQPTPGANAAPTDPMLAKVFGEG